MCQESIDDETVLLALYVDDSLILARNQETIHKILKALKTEFEVNWQCCLFLGSRD